MLCVQYLFFSSSKGFVETVESPSTTLKQEVNCLKHSPGMYSRICIQIVLFYAAIAYGISGFGAYLCWEADAEERELNAAFKSYVKFK